jgi:hypothetical protein
MLRTDLDPRGCQGRPGSFKRTPDQHPTGVLTVTTGANGDAGEHGVQRWDNSETNKRNLNPEAIICVVRKRVMQGAAEMQSLPNRCAKPTKPSHPENTLTNSPTK